MKASPSEKEQMRRRYYARLGRPVPAGPPRPKKPRRSAVPGEWKLQRRYGITIAERDAILKKQGGKCAICRRPIKPGKATHVDHCHKSKKVRGILCAPCNVGLGHFDHSITKLAAAIQYLSL